MKTSSSTARPRAPRLPQEKRRQQLLDCAIRVFADQGIGGARHAAVAAEAGVALSTVFHYFPTRDELVSAVLEDVERFYVDLAARVHAADRPAPELLLAHVAAFADSVETHEHHARVWLNWSSAIRGEIWPHYLKLEERVIEIIAATVERGQREGALSAVAPARDSARIMIGAGYMIAQMKLSGRPGAEVDRFLQSLVGLLAGALAG